MRAARVAGRIEQDSTLLGTHGRERSWVHTVTLPVACLQGLESTQQKETRSKLR